MIPWKSNLLCSVIWNFQLILKPSLSILIFDIFWCDIFIQIYLLMSKFPQMEFLLVQGFKNVKNSQKFVTKLVFSEIYCFIYIYNCIFFRKYDLIFSWKCGDFLKPSGGLGFKNILQKISVYFKSLVSVYGGFYAARTQPAPIHSQHAEGGFQVVN